MYRCPNCDAPVAHRASNCSACGANFVGESSWKPVAPTARQASPGRSSLLPWLYGLCLVGLGLAATAGLELLTRHPELFSILFYACVALVPASLGIHIMWLGLSLMRTRDFGRFNWSFDIAPRHVDLAAKLFGSVFMTVGILTFWMGGFFFFRLPLLPWLLSLAICLTTFQVLIFALGKRR